MSTSQSEMHHFQMRMIFKDGEMKTLFQVVLSSLQMSVCVYLRSTWHQQAICLVLYGLSGTPEDGSSGSSLGLFQFLQCFNSQGARKWWGKQKTKRIWCHVACDGWKITFTRREHEFHETCHSVTFVVVVNSHQR